MTTLSCKYCVHMYVVNGKMIPDENIPGIGGGMMKGE
jgi:hypothetical protein